VDPHRIKKVAAIVLRPGPSGEEVLVFDHPTDDAGVMVQFPAGTIEPGESPEYAVIRELKEETGINGRIVNFVGELDQEWKDLLWHRWFYIIEPIGEVKDQWPYHCDCGIPITIRWEPFKSANVYESQKPWLEMAQSFYYSPD
jgi:8-oxo-dGTP pyrophosphatase MutT (NUDIX family)